MNHMGKKLILKYLPADRDASALKNLARYCLTTSLGDFKRSNIPF